MTILTASPSWDDVRQLETTDRALGGAGGVMNQQAQALLNRSELLRRQQATPVLGAAGDGVTDDTGAIQAAINSCSAGAVFIPAGNYKLSRELTITNPLVTIVGAGIDATILRQADGAANGLNFDYPILFGHPTGGGVCDITIESGAGLATSKFFGSGSTGAAIRLKNASDNFAVRRVSLNNFARGAYLIYCWNTRWSDLRVLCFATSGIEIDLDGSNIGGSNSFTASKISNNGFSGVNTASAGIRILASGGELFDNIDVTSTNNGVLVAPASGSQQVLYLFFNQVLADTCLASGWEVNGETAPVQSINMADCWGAYNGGHGLYVHGPQVDSIRWVGGRLRQNQMHGAFVSSSARNVAFNSAEVASNSRTNGNTYHGLRFEGGANNWQVLGSRIGNYAPSSGTQGYGVSIGSDSGLNFTIADNDLTGNSTSGVQLGVVASNAKITGNLPLLPATNASDALAMYAVSLGTVAAGATVYLGPAGQYSTLAAAPFVVPRNGVGQTMYVKTANPPGIGQTFTYTLFKQAATTGLTFTISDSAQNGQVSLSSLNINATDALEIKIVTSAGAAVTTHRGFITVE